MASEEDLIPGLPLDVALECLVRASDKSHGEMQRVCRAWRSLVTSQDFYTARSRSDHTRPVICVVQALPATGEKSNLLPGFILSLYDPATSAWEKLPQIPELSHKIPLFCRIVSHQGKIYLLGGWNPTTYEAMKSVFRFDFTTRGWTRLPDMSVPRSFFACAVSPDGKIYVAGGHDGDKTALRSCERFDIGSSRWESMADMAQERDESHALMLNNREFMVIGGYSTDSQGEFTSTAEILDPVSGEWRSEEVESRSMTGSASGAVYSFRENGDVWKMGNGRAGRVPVKGEILALAACPGSRRLKQEIVVWVRDGACRGLWFDPVGKGSWGFVADGGDEFSGHVEASCLVEI